MEDANTTEILSRMQKASRTSTDAALAQAIGVSPQSVSDARRKRKVPPAWAITLATKYQVLLDWIVFGRGPMSPSSHAADPSQGSIDEHTLFIVIEAIEEFLDEAGKSMSPDKKAKLISMLYQHYTSSKEEDKRPAVVLRFIRNALASNE